mmetsp:Transcript_25275/g.61471  ORF Transcript_25275/g.61471 Transcript_25275/m.61471 type:complete len:209 (+) Transcript_25275:1072-1698(+)
MPSVVGKRHRRPAAAVPLDERLQPIALGCPVLERTARPPRGCHLRPQPCPFALVVANLVEQARAVVAAQARTRRRMRHFDERGSAPVRSLVGVELHRVARQAHQTVGNAVGGSVRVGGGRQPLEPRLKRRRTLRDALLVRCREQVEARLVPLDARTRTHGRPRVLERQRLWHVVHDTPLLVAPAHGAREPHERVVRAGGEVGIAWLVA